MSNVEKTSNLDKLSNLKLHNVWMNRIPRLKGYNNEVEGTHTEAQVIGFEWSSDLGFGRYQIIRDVRIDESKKPYDDGYEIVLGIYGESECMDSNEDKSMLRELMRQFVDMVEIVE